MNVKYLAVAAALMGAASFTSCSNQEDAVAEIQTKTTCPKVINVKVDGGTRAVMGEGNKPMWEAAVVGSYNGMNYVQSGDFLEVHSYNEEGSQIYAYYACTDPSTNEFTLLENSFPKYDVYHNIIGAYTWIKAEDGTESTSVPVGPFVVVTSGTYSSIDVDLVNKTITIKQPWGINPVPGDLGNAYMIGTTVDLTQCTLHNSMALLKVTIPASPEMVYLRLGLNSAPEATYSYESMSIVNIEEASYDGYYDFSLGDYWYGDHGITADMLEPLTPGVYYFPVLPQTLTSTVETPFCFRVNYTNNKWDAPANGYADPDDSFFTTKTKTGTVTLEAGKIYDLGTLTVDF